MMKKMFFGLLLMAAVFAQGMNFAGFNNYKLSTAPGTGVNPPSGNISIWWTVTDSTLTMHWRDSSGADHTFSSGGGGLADAPSDGKQYCRKDAAWVEVVSSGVTPTVLTPSGSPLTATIPGPGLYTLTPSAATLFATGTFANLDNAEISITNGNGLISFPSSWYWQTSIPTLQINGVDVIKIKKVLKGSDEKILAWYEGSYIGLTGNDANTIFLLNTATSTNAFYDMAAGVSTVAALTLYNSPVSDTVNQRFGVNTLPQTATVPTNKQSVLGILNSEESVSTEGTVDFCLRITDVSASAGVDPILFQITNTAWSQVSYLIFFESVDELRIHCASGSNYSFTTAGRNLLKDGSWHHVAIVWTSGTTHIYIDGVQDGTISGNMVSAIKYVYVGDSGGGSSGYWTGNFAQFRVSKTARWTSGFTPPTMPYGN